MGSVLAAFVDGVPVTGTDSAGALLEDRGLHYGDGVFETMLARGGRIRFAALHRARLEEGCRRLSIPLDAGLALDEAAAVAAGHGAAVLKLIVTRGTATARGYAPSGSERPRRVLLAYPAPAADDGRAPARALLLDAVYGENPRLAGLKHLNRLEQVLARQELQQRDPGAFEGVVAGSSGLLVSGTMSNMFLLAGDELLTPRVDRCGIAGVTRAVVLREAPRLGLRVREAGIAPDLLGRCDALCFSNVRLGLRPVTQLGTRALSVPEALRALQSRLAVLDD